MYVTYDLPQTSPTRADRSEPLIRGAKEFTLPGPLIKWGVGQFDNPSGAKSYGVQLEYADPLTGSAFELIDVPATAMNIHVHTGALPRDYHSALKTAV